MTHLDLLNTIRGGSISEVENALQDSSELSPMDLSACLIASISREDTSDISVTKAVLRAGADPNLQPNDSMPPLHLAIELGRINIVELLLEHGAAVNFRDLAGWTPLHQAVEIEGDAAWQASNVPSCKLVCLLLNAGADPSLKTYAGETALDFAKEYGHKAAIELLDENRI